MDRRNFLKAIAALPLIPLVPAVPIIVPAVELPQIFVEDDPAWAALRITVEYKNRYVWDYVKYSTIRKYPETINKVLADFIYRVYPNHRRISITYQEGMWTVCLDNKSITTKDHTQINRRLYEMQMR